MIVIEGIIGVGKSTLCQALAKHLEGSELYLEPTDHPYLPLFYKDMARWALEMQFYLMARRFQQHEEAIRLEWSRGIQTIHDRSIWGDRAFADMLRKDGLISELGYSSYMMHRRCMLGFLLVPQIVVWLDAAPEVCLQRIGDRDRSCESGITTQYLTALRDSYKTILAELESKGSTILYYDWNKIPPVRMVVDDLMQRKETGKLFHFQHEYYRKNPIEFSNGNGNGAEQVREPAMEK
jgi:deoxyadenosine/deoxycytidine kinase